MMLFRHPMKAFIICVLLLSYFHTPLFAQEIECNYEMPEAEATWLEQNLPQIRAWEKAYLKRLNNRQGSSTCLDQVPISPFIFRRGNGTGGLTPAQLAEAMVILNDFFENIDMEFYICDSIQFINSDEYYDFNTNQTSELRSTYNNPNTLNIYFFNRIRSGDSYLCGRAGSYILMNNSCTMNGSTFSHEVGHTFGLPHTHVGNTSSNPELVDGSNCMTAGDLFCDTPADPRLSSSTVTSGCVYTGTAVDANGDTYQPDPRNVMSYSRKHCRDVFSPQQFARMRYYHENVRNSYSCQEETVEITVDQSNHCSLPATVSFSSNISNATTYEWDFDGDGIVDSNDPTPTYTYTTEGDFLVSLSVRGGLLNVNCADASEFISVEEVPEVDTLELIRTTVFCRNSPMWLSTIDVLPDGWQQNWQFWNGTDWVNVGAGYELRNDTLFIAEDITAESVLLRLQIDNICGDEEISEPVSVEFIPNQEDFSLTHPADVCAGESLVFNAEIDHVISTQWYIDTAGRWDILNGETESLLQLIVPDRPFSIRAELVNICAQNILGESTTINPLLSPEADQTVESDNADFTFQALNPEPGDIHRWFLIGADADTLTGTEIVWQPTANGTYTWMHEVIGKCSTRESSFEVTVAIRPTAMTSFSPLIACTPFELTLEDQSIFADQIQWLFPGGTPAESIESNPTVQYAVPGVYSIYLIAENGVGIDTLRLENSMELLAPATAAFSVEEQGVTITFMNESSNSDSYLWDFGDGTTSTEESPVYSFPGDGEYEVILIASNAGCSDTLIQTVIISATSVHHVNTAQIKLLPNPAESFIQLEGLSMKQVDWKIYNAYGQLCLLGEEINLTGSTRIELGDLPSGAYFIWLQQPNGQMVSLRFVRM